MATMRETHTVVAALLLLAANTCAAAHLDVRENLLRTIRNMEAVCMMPVLFEGLIASGILVSNYSLCLMSTTRRTPLRSCTLPAQPWIQSPVTLLQKFSVEL